MNRIIPHILRRMRAPLVALIVVYAVSILGLVLIPGQPMENGEPWRMDFFHAFYFVSYMATTIGFGELPFEFSAAQRMWTIVSIYLTVITWLYAIGKILTLVQDPAFKQSVVEQAFARAVRHLQEPFHIICGHGDTGSLLVRAMCNRGMRAVVIDIDPERISDIQLEDYAIYIPGLLADASLADSLIEAGLYHAKCAGVVALTNSDESNLKIAITVKLLKPDLRVICRAEHHEVEANMASFGTDEIINPFDAFADRLALALHSPASHLLQEWLTGVPGAPLPMPLYPVHGKWVLCGYGRFGKAVKANLDEEGIETVIVEARPEETGCVDRCVVGRGTEAETLEMAQVQEAVGIVAGTDNDANNLSIVMTARELKPDLFMVARQNQRQHDPIFEAARLDLVMQRSEAIARQILARLATPLLPEFLERSREQGDGWVNELISRLTAIVGERVPEVWSITLDRQDAPTVPAARAEDLPVQLADLLRDPGNRERNLPVIVLMMLRDGRYFLTPEDQPIYGGDRLLLCAREGVRERMEWSLKNRNAFEYVRSGEMRPDGWFWRLISRRREAT